MQVWKGACLLIGLGLGGGAVLHAQGQRYLIFFEEKPDSLLPYPETYLSAKALERRRMQGIAIDRRDLPVPAWWVAEMGRSGRVIGVSRWLNAALLELAPGASLPQAPFIACVEPLTPRLRPFSPLGKTPAISIHTCFSQVPEGVSALRLTETQLGMLHIPELHRWGLYGRGIRVAIFDAGFPGMDQVAAFRHLFVQGRLIAKYDFVSGDSVVFDDNPHGTMVASVIVARDSGLGYVGGAPEVEVLLARTEDALSESRMEEWNWTRAAEWADSLGAFIIQSSLGYSTFDDPNENYTYADMDGRTAITTRAARIAAQKGLLVVSSAGNEGNSAWRYITAPADADSILSAGATDATGQVVAFSSRGPTADGRIKPDVVAMGLGTQVVLPNGSTGGAAGTSFSAPLITSLAACLWQSRPATHAQALRQAILESADHFHTPDTAHGYGIPHGLIALTRLTALSQEMPYPLLRLFPNPTTDHLSLVLADTTLSWYTLLVCDETGRQIYTTSYRGLTLLTIPTTSWRPGLYWVHLSPVEGSRKSFQAAFIRL